MIRNKNAMAGRIIAKILTFYQEKVLDKSQYFEKKFEIERILFLKIFNLYTSMAFITTHNVCMKISEKNKVNAKSSDEVMVNSQDIDIEVEKAGVDLDIVKQNAFPQLIFESKAVIEKMFDWVKGDIDLKTRLLPFEAFLSLVIAFNTKTVG